ncbi:MAG TPA: tripartite tricarboxylate transporter TctB family protein [Desulfosporosinus sp.]|nr:tripartite tricarboxylate transporter TctB family protein [Desulfosporosinus sp.]
MSLLLINRLSGFLFLLLGVFVWIVTPSQIADAGLSYMGPRFFPQFLSIFLMILSIVLIAGSFSKKQKSQGEDQELQKEFTISSEIKVILSFLLIIIYTYIMEPIGFVLSTIVIMGLLMFLLNVRKWYYYVIFIAVTLVIYYAFVHLLYVELP